MSFAIFGQKKNKDFVTKMVQRPHTGKQSFSISNKYIDVESLYSLSELLTHFGPLEL